MKICRTTVGGWFLVVLFLSGLFNGGVLATPHIEAEVTNKPAGKETRSEPVVLRGARLLVGDGEVVTPGVVRIEGKRIQAVGASVSTEGARVIDLGERTLVPGLIDLHTHVSVEVGLSPYERIAMTPAKAAVAGVVNAEATLMAGFTTIRDVGGFELVDVALRDKIAEGMIPGPRMFVATVGIGTTGGHADNTNYFPPYLESSYLTGVVDGPHEVTKRVREEIKWGADHIKIVATGGVLSHGDEPGSLQMTFEEIKAAVDAATMAGRHVASHCHGTEGILLSSRAGVHSIEHGSFQTEESIRVCVENGTWVVPTLYVIEPILAPGNPLKIPEDSLRKAREVREAMHRSFRLALAAGVKIAFGTDAGVFPHGTQAREFALYVELGMTPMEAIQTATQKASQLLGKEDEFGTIRAGLFADLIAVDGNPLEEISALEKVDFVMKEGRIHKGPGATR